MSEEKKAISKEELEQGVGGEIHWGPFHDVTVSCPHCGRWQVVNYFPTDCFDCKTTIYERDYKE